MKISEIKYDHLTNSQNKIIGCFPLYPPVELFHSLDLQPLIMWGFKNLFSSTHLSDQHIQDYVCSIARHLTEFTLSDYGEILEGIFFYNACDSLRNLPEILAEGLRELDRTINYFHFHIPMKSIEKNYVYEYLKNEVDLLINQLEENYSIESDFERFKESVELYRKFREYSKIIEKKIIQSSISYREYVKIMHKTNLLNVKDKVEFLNLYNQKLEENQKQIINKKNEKVLLSGILPPPLKIIEIVENSGFQIVGNDIASLRRTIDYTPEKKSFKNIGEYYIKFYNDHFPCPTLLYSSDRRIEKLLELISLSQADAVIFIGEKFCEYEYFEFPTISNELSKQNLKILNLEFSAEQSYNLEAYKTRIDAFYELIINN